jgi:putative Mg2+ transporter-C (MgtC) family protein
MLTIEQMVLRLLVALVLGALIGLERELVGKYEAGIRTTMVVCGGAAIFSIIAIALPYIIMTNASQLPDIIARNSGFLAVIANIVVGIGFLGAGIILKTGGRVRGLTTAADVWFAAAIGTLAGIGLLEFAFISAILITGLLYLLRKVKLYEHVRPGSKIESGDD